MMKHREISFKNLKGHPTPHKLYRHLTLYSLIALGFGLRLFQLNNIAVEKAEMTNIVWFIRSGLMAVLTENKALNNHPLNSVLGYFTSALGYESLFTLRWHSVVIGVLAIAAAMRIARDWFGCRAQLVTGLLITFSAYHVTLSQRARSYVSLVGFTLLGFHLGYRAVQTGQKRYWLGFMLMAVLNIYAHLYGVIAVAVLSLIMAVLLWQKEEATVTLTKLRHLTPLLASLILAYLLALGLYLPMWGDTASVAGQTNIFRDSDLRHAEQFSLWEQISQPIYETIRPFSIAQDDTRLRLGDSTFHYGPLDNIAILAENRVGFYFALFTCLMGIIIAWQKFRQRALIITGWLILPFVMQGMGSMILPGAYFRGRFLAFVYPPYLLLSAIAWPGLADILIHCCRHRPNLRPVMQAFAPAGIGALLILNLVWLYTYYTAAINEHWTDIAAYVNQHRQPNDLIICGQRPKTACVFDQSTRTDTTVEELEDFITFDQLRAKRASLEQSGRVWVVLPHLTPEQAASLQNQQPPDHRGLMGNPAYDQAGWWLSDAHSALADNLIAALEFNAAISLDNQERFRNEISLAKIHLVRKQLTGAGAAIKAARQSAPTTPDAQTSLTTVEEQLAYARDAAQAIASLPPTAIQLNRDYGGLAQLTAYEITPPTLTPGGTVRVTLYWQPLALISQDLVSFVHLTDLQANIIGQADGIPDNGLAPTFTWRPGQLITDPYTITINSAVSPPLAVRLEAGLFAPADYKFIPPLGEMGQPINAMMQKMTVAEPAEPPPPPPDHPVQANFADQIMLTGYDLLTLPPGIVFHWKPLVEMDENYTLFIHVLDPSGSMQGQVDGQPFQGNYPTSWWTTGKAVLDQRQFPPLESGDHQVVIGWYRAPDGPRLPLADGSDSLPLLEIKIP